MQWTRQQSEALTKTGAWIKDRGGKQIFRLFGHAGTGKTTLARYLAKNCNGIVLFAAFTGKAALVLRQKGCAEASTIHSLIYKLVEDEDGGAPEFTLNPDSALTTASLLVVDEVSMVDEEIGRDLLSFGVKILVLGDPAQLPPVNGAGFFINGEPDVMLTDISRQAADNPIIRMSMDVREGKRLQLGSYGDSKIITRRQVDRTEVMQADQILVGLNKTRRTYNSRVRELRGAEGFLFPMKSDRVICLRNNKELGLFNGGLWNVVCAERNASVINMHLSSLDEPDRKDIVEVDVPIEFFLGTESTLDYKVRRQLQEFDYGYAITIHKSQGSQFNSVYLFDESSSFRENRINHLYTAVTRAVEKITIVI